MSARQHRDLPPETGAGDQGRPGARHRVRDCEVSCRLIDEVARAKGVTIDLKMLAKIDEITRLGVLLTAGANVC